MRFRVEDKIVERHHALVGEQQPEVPAQHEPDALGSAQRPPSHNQHPTTNTPPPHAHTPASSSLNPRCALEGLGGEERFHLPRETRSLQEGWGRSTHPGWHDSLFAAWPHLLGDVLQPRVPPAADATVAFEGKEDVPPPLAVSRLACETP